jgi:hypothetical protein
MDMSKDRRDRPPTLTRHRRPPGARIEVFEQELVHAIVDRVRLATGHDASHEASSGFGMG